MNRKDTGRCAVCKRALKFGIFAVILGGVSSCQVVFEKQTYKRLIISDIDSLPQSTAVSIQAIEGEYALVVLLANWPDLSKLSVDQILSSPYAVTKVKDGIIDTKLSAKFDYWDGAGAYWIVILLPDSRAETVSYGFLSKDVHSFFQKITYVSSMDIAPPVKLNLDLRGFIPF